MRSALITISTTDLIGRDVRPWLTEMQIKFSVRGGLISIMEFPPTIEIKGLDHWPALYSTRHWLQGNPNFGHDVIADIDPDTGKIDIRDRWWIEEDEV